ncbi:MAG: RecX family transcriptional regulator [Bacteroidetes bacterium]|nr:RecX family transcriptional regulator [Bacteroidota bacterium]
MENGPQFKKTLTPSQAKPKIEKFCAYQERSHQQVKRKLMGYGLNYLDADILLVELMQSNFLKLKREGVGEKLIQQALASLGMDDYLKTLDTLAEKKWPLIKGNSHLERVFKLKRYLVGKGYDFEAIDRAIARVTKGE